MTDSLTKSQFQPKNVQNHPFYMQHILDDFTSLQIPVQNPSHEPEL